MLQGHLVAGPGGERRETEEMEMAPTLEDVTAALADAGLVMRGGFHPVEDDAVPGLPSGAPAATLILAGNIGGSLWQMFSEARPGQSADNEGHPMALDDWSRETLDAVTEKLGGPAACAPLFPFGGPPFQPFLRWAQKAEPVFPSPIGPLIHPDHGLWHAYRGALAFAARIDLPPRPERESPCLTCDDKPCLRGCPVGAHEENRFDLGACIGHIDTAAGSACMANGCLARRACPVGRDSRYEPDQARFHMTAFRRANRKVLKG